LRTTAVPTLATRDPLAMLGMTLALIAVALVARYLPAGAPPRSIRWWR